MREDLAKKLRTAHFGDYKTEHWKHADPETKEAWGRVADVVISMIETTVAYARPPEKTSKMRQALWNIIEEAQIALKAD